MVAPNPSVFSNLRFPQSPFLDPQTGRPAREWVLWLQNPNVFSIAMANALPVNSGGTGINTTPSNGQLLIGNGAGYSLGTISAGQNVKITNGAGTITVAIDGVIPVANGGTGADNADDARINFSAAKLGDNTDITSLTGITGGIETPDYVKFDTSAAPTISIGVMGWNSTDQTLDLGMDYGVVQQIGEETYARVKNNTGVTIPNGTVVGFAGASANALAVSPYLANGSSPTLYILGVMTHDLPDSGEKGYCTVWGFVRGLNTSAYSVGDVLYASPSVAGGLTKTKPTAPNNVIPIAAVVVSDASAGVIFVRPTIQAMQYYGMFSKTSTATPAAINTAYALTIDNTAISNGVVIGTPASRLVVPVSGLYQLDATFQISSGSSSAKNMWLWLRKNGSDIANSARIATSDINNGYIAVTIQQTMSMAASDYVEIMYAADSTNISIASVAATAFSPAAPACIVSLVQVQQ